MFTKTIAATLSLLLLAASTTSAAPTVTKKSPATGTWSLTGVTHSVVAGRGGLRFDPDNVVAQVGDVVEWHFGPKNHSVAQSSFSSPCVPLPAGTPSFFSGFQPVADGQAPNVFQIVVEDASKPIWYYCAQTTGSHCQNGMVGVINQNFDGPNTLAAHRALAAKTTVSVVPPVQGGKVIPNPNPLSGF